MFKGLRIRKKNVDTSDLQHSSLSPTAVAYARDCLEEQALPFLPVENVLDEISGHTQEMASAAKTLSERGIVTFSPHFNLSTEVSEDVTEVRKLVAALKRDQSALGINETFRLSKPREKYYSMAKSPIPVVSIRSGVDAGMADIFHAEKLFPSLGDAVKDAMHSIDIESLLKKVTGKHFRFSNFNLYVNDSVMSTRGWHVDSYGGKQFKAFMYLTDVEELSSGPYCYVVDSPSELGFEEANRRYAAYTDLKPTDITLFRKSKALALLGRQGQIVISNQSGAHRGYPQKDGAFRCVAALNFIEV